MFSTVNSGKETLWRSRLQRFQASGLSILRFCEREGVSVPSFYQWRKRLGMPTVKGTAATFVPVRMTQLTPSASVEIHLPNGARICVPSGDADTLQVAIAAAGRLSDQESEADIC